jgi:hypothetical protein
LGRKLKKVFYESNIKPLKKELFKCKKCDGYNFVIKNDDDFIVIPPVCIFCGGDKFEGIYSGKIIEE